MSTIEAALKLKMVFIFNRSLRITALAGGYVALASTTAVLAQVDRAERAQRIASMVSVAADEYRLGVVRGRVVRSEEVKEAELFLTEALGKVAELGSEASRARQLLDSMLYKVSSRSAAEELVPLLEEFLSELERVVGLSLDPAPREVPSIVAGSALYGEFCAKCHGVSGAGDGPLAEGMIPAPTDFADLESVRPASPLDFFRKLDVGVAGTAMPAFGHRLSFDDRWALALYASTLRYTDAQRARGSRLLEERCPSCVVRVSDFRETSQVSDDSLAVLLAAGTGLDGSDSLLSDAVAFARLAGAVEFLGRDKEIRAALVALQVKERLNAAVRLFVAGDKDAADARAVDGYLAFEHIERAIKARELRAAARVELAFANFRAAIAGSDLPAVNRAREEVEGALDAAVLALSRSSTIPVLLGQSIVIMLREGLEAILIVGALIAFLTKAGATRRRREIVRGVLAAVAASLATAVAFATVLSGAVASQELLEGLTMLLAALVLFWVSYWLVSKIEIRKWQQFIANQMAKALSSRRALALAGVAFLAVYREGFETVLFYMALFAAADGAVGGAAAIFGGMVTGAVLLGAVYYVVLRYGVRMPLKPFFAVTSAFLYLMAFSFAGKGIAELQQAGYVSSTPLSWLPTIPALGVFPTTQTASIQLLLALAFAGALFWVFWLEPRKSAVPLGPRGS